MELWKFGGRNVAALLAVPRATKVEYNAEESKKREVRMSAGGTWPSVQLLHCLQPHGF